MITDEGELGTGAINEMNVPINCFIRAPTAEEPYWVWTAMNYMPRKEYCSKAEYRLEADTREELVDWVNKNVVPLYEAALFNLKNSGENYYWKKGEVSEEEPVEIKPKEFDEPQGWGEWI